MYVMKSKGHTVAIGVVWFTVPQSKEVLSCIWWLYYHFLFSISKIGSEPVYHVTIITGPPKLMNPKAKEDTTRF